MEADLDSSYTNSRFLNTLMANRQQGLIVTIRHLTEVESANGKRH
jgi:hypothetical protein